MVWAWWKRKKRLRKFGEQLPDALELVARALRAGHSLAAGFHLVGDEMSAPMGEEFTRVYEEQNLGIPLEIAGLGAKSILSGTLATCMTGAVVGLLI